MLFGNQPGQHPASSHPVWTASRKNRLPPHPGIQGELTEQVVKFWDSQPMHNYPSGKIACSPRNPAKSAKTAPKIVEFKDSILPILAKMSVQVAHLYHVQ